MSKKRRVYQVAKEFDISNEALIKFLLKLRFDIRNHMSQITDEMFDEVVKNYGESAEPVGDEYEFRKMLKERMDLLKMDHSFAGRYLNDGFSGGEKKRAEILQMATLQPEIAILDETDSGLDIDALRIVSEGVNALRGPDFGAVVITHYQRILNYIQPDFVHIMLDGRIVESGGPELALQLEEQGYDWVREKYSPAVA